MNVYIIIVLVLVAVIGFAASYTFLFNIGEITVSGESDMYSAEQIVDASGIHEGDNLLRLDTEKSEQKILDELLYVETAEVNRDFPSSLEIKVTRCIPSFNVNIGSKTLLISKQGKILAINSFITDGLPVFYGYKPAEKEPGDYIYSEDEFKNDAFTALITSLAKLDDTSAGISNINLVDEHNIIINYRNGMVFKMGNWNDAEYKLNMAATVMNDPAVNGKKGFLTMIGSNQCSFRTTDEPVEVPGNIDPPKKKKKTDENGEPVEESEPSVESNPDQEERFSDYNSQNDEEREGYFNFEEEGGEEGEGTEQTTNEQGYVLDENGGYYDADGFYYDQWGYYYDSYGNYYDPYGNLVAGVWDENSYDNSYDQGW